MSLSKNKFFHNPGFTMLELVIIVSVLLVLGAATFIWLDPAARITQAKDSRRLDDVMALSAAFSDYTKQHKGALPILGEVTTAKKVLCNTQSGVKVACDGDIEYCLKIDDSTFFSRNLTNLPIDPDKSDDSDTGYYLKKDANNNISIGACNNATNNIYDRPQIKATCSAYGGGYCWYTDDGGINNCDNVCAANGLTCASVTNTTDSLCLISDALNSEVYSCTECVAGGSGQPAGWADDNTCSYPVGTLNCATDSIVFPDCPCQ